MIHSRYETAMGAITCSRARPRRAVRAWARHPSAPCFCDADGQAKSWCATPDRVGTAGADRAQRAIL